MLGMFWTVLAGAMMAIIMAAVCFFLFHRVILNLAIDRVTRILSTESYKENILEMVNILCKLTPIGLAELEMRSETGQPPMRPFGARRIHSDWSKFMFAPVYISKPPLPTGAIVETETRIGPLAGKPLQLAIPLLIGGMSWGNALSARTKIALARGATLAGTAANTGTGPFLPAERAEAKLLVVQVAKSHWMRDPEILKQADMIEVSLGHGASDSASQIIRRGEVQADAELQAAFGANRVAPKIDTYTPEGPGVKGLTALFDYLREQTAGIPIGVKIGATDRLEAELAAILQVNPDFITIDGCEGGTQGGTPALLDSVGLPTLPALYRAECFLRMHGQRERVSLLVGGGLYEPGHFLVAMALGADAVCLGTSALMALAHGQVEKATPFEPPTQLLFHTGKKAKAFEPNKGAISLAKFLAACTVEMSKVAQVLGRSSLGEVCREDLCCLDQDLAMLTGVRWAMSTPAPEDQ